MSHEPGVLIVDLSKYFGGTDVRVLNLARALHGKRDYAVAVLEGSPLHQRLQAENLNAAATGYRRSDPRLIGFLRGVMRERGFKIIDTHNPQSQFWGAIAARLTSGVKAIATMHSAYRLEHNGSLKGRLYEQVIHLHRLVGGDFIAVSEAVQQYLIECGVPAARIHLIANAIMPDESASQPLALFDEFGWGDDSFIVTAVGRLEPVKAHSVLIAAITALKDEFPQLRCAIVGEGRLRDELQAQIDHLHAGNYIRLTGFLTNVQQILYNSQLFCMPSRSEGLPYALLEAMSAQLPIVASNVGGMATLLMHEQTAYLVPPDDVGALEDAIRWMLINSDDAQQIATRAHALQQERFSVDVMVKETLAAYDSMLNDEAN